MPHFIVDIYLRDLSPSATKVFIFLNRKVIFDEDSPHFGKCWLTHGEIAEGTGVKASNMAKYLKELERLGLITYSWSRICNQGAVKTIHVYTVTWLSVLRNLKVGTR